MDFIKMDILTHIFTSKIYTSELFPLYIAIALLLTIINSLNYLIPHIKCIIKSLHSTKLECSSMMLGFISTFFLITIVLLIILNIDLPSFEHQALLDNNLTVKKSTMAIWEYFDLRYHD
jgi:hypothetical protein